MDFKGLRDEIKLWDIDHVSLQDRIEARRERIAKRVDAAKRLARMVRVQNVFESGLPRAEEDFQAGGNHVQFQQKKTERHMDEMLGNGCELLDNVRLAADRLQVQHRDRIERRDQAIAQVLKQENEEADLEYEEIQRKWPGTDGAKNAPIELFTEILEQRQACNALLEKRNDLIATLEEELQDSDDQYQILIDEYHENISVLAARMEQLLQTFENVSNSERFKLEDAFEREVKEKREEHEDEWEGQLNHIQGYSMASMEARLTSLQTNEDELDHTLLEDAEAFTVMKHALEDKVNRVADQVQFMNSVNALNEERLDYEIHVLRKHEEEIALVKADQKRRITSLQDTINKLKIKVSLVQKATNKGEEDLHAQLVDIRKQLQKLGRMSKNNELITLRKQNDLVNMARDNSMERVQAIARTDFELQLLYTSDMPQTVKLYVEPLFNSRLAKRSSALRTRSNTFHREPSSRGGLEKRSSVHLKRRSPSGERRSVQAGGTFKRFELREALGSLVHEAGFLVEENLSLLVEGDDITQDDKNLFKLDSILNTIGVRGEDEIREVLQTFCQDPSKTMKDNVLKLIRQHLERSKRRGSDDLDASPLVPETLGSSRASSARRAVCLYENLEEMTQDWTAMTGSFKTFESRDRMDRMVQLRGDYKSVLKIEQLDKEQSSLDRQVRELCELTRKFGYFGDLSFAHL